jgi:hypothetical protein
MEMGDGGAGHGAVGRAAVRHARRVRFVLLLLTPLTLGGCKFAGEMVAAAAGGATAAGTANPAIGVAVGIAVNAGIDAATDYIVKKRQQAEQDAIAAEVAGMAEGDRRPWKIEHDIPIGNEHGEVQVTRVIDTKLTQCKELVFSVDSGEGEELKQAWYTTQACQNGDHWKWAQAEPTVQRWGFLQ